jgi:hypothetical protein
MGERENMLLALGIDPTAGVSPPPAPPGLVDLLAQNAKENAARFGHILGGAASGAVAPLAPLRPYGEGIKMGVDAAGALANPIGAAINAGSTLANNPGMATRVGEVALGLPHDRERVGVTTRTHDAEPSDIRPMNTDAAPFSPAPTPASTGSPGIAPGVMGGGGFGGLERNLRDAQGRQIRGYGDAADLERELGIDQALKAQGMSDTYAAHASRLEQQAEDQQRIDAIAAEKHDAFMARQETLANDLAKQQIDPGRLIRDADLGTQVTMGLGAAIGGAFGNGHNSYLDRLDKLIDRDISAQIQDIDSKKASYSARSTLFGQMMQETGDRRLAAMTTRKLTYDAMQQKVLSDGERLGIPIVKDQAAIMAQTFAQKSADLQAQIAAAALQQAKAAAAAAVAAQRAAEERAYQKLKDAEHLKLEYYKVNNAGKASGDKDASERRVVIDGQDALATNKKAAEDWGNYTHGRAVVADMLAKLKAAREAGNVGEYDAARGLLIEEVPKLLGYARGPSMGQIKETLGPEVVPKYNHWYNHASGPIGYSVEQGRSAEKLRVLEDLLATSDRAVREQTFGAKIGAAPAAPRFTPDAPKAK